LIKILDVKINLIKIFDVKINDKIFSTSQDTRIIAIFKIIYLIEKTMQLIKKLLGVQINSVPLSLHIETFFA